MDQRKSLIKIDEYIETNLTHGEWHDQFAQWLESRNESFSCGTKGSVSSRRKSVFTEEFQKIIKATIEKGKYDPDEDPFLLEHRRKVWKIMRGR